MQAHHIVILTREAEDNRGLAEQLSAAGIRVLQYPCIKTTILPFGKGSHLPEGLALADFHTLVFTSKRGVFAMADAAHLITDTQQIAVVGETTAAAVSEILNRSVDLIAEPQTAEGLAGQLVQRLSAGDSVLHIRGNKTTGIFKQIMNQHHIEVTELEVYRNEAAELEALQPCENALVVFASPSAAQNFFLSNSDPTLTHHWNYLAIGPTTAGYLRKAELPNIHELSKPTNLSENITEIIKHIKRFSGGQGGRFFKKAPLAAGGNL